MQDAELTTADVQASFKCLDCPRPVVRAGTRGKPPSRCPTCAAERKRALGRDAGRRYRENNLEASRGHNRRFLAGYRGTGRLAEVGERDWWTCSVCQGAVDRHLDKDDPNSAKLKWREFPTLLEGGQRTNDDYVLCHERCKRGPTGPGQFV